MTFDPDDPRLTAYALGELDPTPKARDRAASRVAMRPEVRGRDSPDRRWLHPRASKEHQASPDPAVGRPASHRADAQGAGTRNRRSDRGGGRDTRPSPSQRPCSWAQQSAFTWNVRQTAPCPMSVFAIKRPPSSVAARSPVLPSHAHPARRTTAVGPGHAARLCPARPLADADGAPG